MARPSLVSVACVALLVLFAARLVDSAFQNSLTMDEPHYIGKGLYLWESGDYHYATSLSLHPPLAYHLASLPLLALDRSRLTLDASVGRQLLRGDLVPPRTLRVASRLPFVLLALWGALLTFAWAREIAGNAAGLLGLFLFTFSPMALAHGSLAHSDITVSVFFFQTVYALWRYLEKPSRSNLVVCGVSFGLALLSKLSAFLAFGFLPVLLAAHALGWIRPGVDASDASGSSSDARNWIRAGLAAVSITALAMAVVWLGWGASFAFQPVEAGPLAGISLPGFVHAGLVDRVINDAGRETYLFGEFSQKGWWYLFPAAFAVKTPIGVLALIALALIAPVHRARPLGRFLAVVLAVYLGVAMFYLDVPLGLRYMLPLYPLLFVFAAVRVVPLGSGARRVVVLLCCAWIAAASFWIRPHYLAYFNELAGGPARGPHLLLDANVDWGQGLPALAEWLDERGNPEVALAYFGPEDPARYGIRARRLRGCQPVEGLVAISANIRHHLYAAHNPLARPNRGCYRWLDEHEPVARPSWSILVYDLSP